MSCAHNIKSESPFIERVERELLARAASVDSTKDGMSILVDMSRTYGQHCADRIYLKVTSKPGWTAASIQDLVKSTLDWHANAIVETMHASGGTIEMVTAMCDALLAGYQDRVDQLGFAAPAGGRQ